tara:strand:+ start:212 stop:1243 length:1032 start_codon:yes stop_codon:yes gene_type:complete
MSKNILVTGGAGFIGHQVINLIFNSTDWNVTLIDRLSYAGNLNRVNEVINDSQEGVQKRFKFLYHDLKAPISDQMIRELENINIILHIGASSHVNRSIQDPNLFVQDNILGTFNLLEAARKIDNLDLFYYFSTDEVFGPSDNVKKFKEWDRYNSKNPYSATKAAGEELTIAYNNTYSIPSLISHCCNVYGVRQNPEKFIPNTIRKILSNEKLTVHTDAENNPGSRYYIFNDDLSKSILYLIDNFEIVKKQCFDNQLKSPPKINISGENLISNLEIVEKVGRLLNKDFDYILENNDPERPGHDIKYGLDVSLIKSIGAHFDRSFDDGLENTVKWFVENQNWLKS